MLGGGIAYIKLNHFNLKTDEELRAALETAMSKNAKGVIMDLRNTPAACSTYALTSPRASSATE